MELQRHGFWVVGSGVLQGPGVRVRGSRRDESPAEARPPFRRQKKRVCQGSDTDLLRRARISLGTWAFTHGDFVTKGTDGCKARLARDPRACYRATESLG
jgi:hypothetical protein